MIASISDAVTCVVPMRLLLVPSPRDSNQQCKPCGRFPRTIQVCDNHARPNLEFCARELCLYGISEEADILGLIKP